MCWISNSKPVKEIAKENISIYKICRCCNNKISAYFYTDTIYTLNEVYKQNQPIIIEEMKYYIFESYMVDKAFHSYLASCEIDFDERGLVKVCHTTYHSYYLVKVIGYIPIGATYYVNDEGEVISDEIVLTSYIRI